MKINQRKSSSSLSAFLPSKNLIIEEEIKKYG